MCNLSDRLDQFRVENRIVGKGSLSVMLVLTRRVAEKSSPYQPEDFLAPKGGQVAGLGGAAVQTILRDHGIDRVLAEEGGRTSRGSIEKMRAYVEFLNEFDVNQPLNLEGIELYWIERVREYFASQPFRMRIDSSRSMRSIVADLVEDAFVRQRECPGMMVAGAVIEHLVGAKLELVLPDTQIEHKGFSVADSGAGRPGDFLVGDTAIHVTTAPTEGLLRKCSQNLDANLRPLIVTTEGGAGGAKALAKNLDLAERIDVIELEQFIATNVFERSMFEQEQRPAMLRELIERYNRIVSECETDPSLQIAVG